MSGAGEPAFTIRPATPDDEPAMTEIQHSSAIHHATIDPDRWRMQSLEEGARSRRYWHGRQPRSEGLVAVADGEVVGMIELWLKRPQDLTGAQIPRIKVDLGLAVAPGLARPRRRDRADARGGGLGARPRRRADGPRPQRGERGRPAPV